MKKTFLAVILIILIGCNIFILTAMRDGYDLSLFGRSNLLTDVAPTESDASSAMLKPFVSSSELADNTSSDTNTVNSDKFYVTLASIGELTDYSSHEIGSDVGNYAANIYNGGNIVKYEKTFYYTDLNNSNYLYFSRSDFSLYSRLNKAYSNCINVYDDKLYYINNSDMAIYSANVTDDNHKKLSDNLAACLVASGDYLYYVMPEDENSQCGELHRMDKDGKNDIKLSPEGYVCENIIPCGDYVLFVNVGNDIQSICALNVTDAEVTELYSGYVSDINYCGGALWFVRHSQQSDAICKVEGDSDEIRILAQAEKIDNMIVDGEYIYYIVGADDDSQCCRISADGTKSEVIYDNSEAVIESFNVIDNCVYFSVSGGNKMRYVIPGDTSVTIMPGLKK